MTVREFLAVHTAEEIAAYHAYERVSGPIGSRYERETLAQIHELLQAIRLCLTQSSDDDTDEDRKVHHYPRAHEIFGIDDQGD